MASISTGSLSFLGHLKQATVSLSLAKILWVIELGIGWKCLSLYLKFLSPISSLSNQKFYPTEKAWYRLSSNSNVAHWMLFLFQMLLLPGTGPQVSCVQPHRTPLQDQAHLRGRGWGKLWGYVIYVLYIGYTIFSNQSRSTLQGVDNFWVLWWIISLNLINCV